MQRQFCSKSIFTRNGDINIRSYRIVLCYGIYNEKRRQRQILNIEIVKKLNVVLHKPTLRDEIKLYLRITRNFVNHFQSVCKI